MSTTPRSMSSAQPYDAISRSPVAIGVVEYLTARGHGAHVFRRTDLFGEQQMQRLDLAQDDGRHRGAGARVKVHGEIQVGPEAFAKHLHVPDGALDLGAGLHPLEQVGQLELERGNSSLLWSGRATRAPLRETRPRRDNSRGRRADPPGRPASHIRAGSSPCRGYPTAPGRCRRSPTPAPDRRDRSCRCT